MLEGIVELEKKKLARKKKPSTSLYLIFRSWHVARGIIH